MSINWQVTKVKINDLKDYDKNARKISKDALEKLATHIKQDGYHQRIICNTDFTIIGGHQRKKALIMAGFDKEDFIECLIPDKELSIDEIDRLNIRDNISFGEYDFDLLKANFTLPSLKEYGLDSDLIRALQKDEDKNLLEQEDAEVEALSLEPNAKLGDIYVLGNNRLMCGDSTNPQHVEKLMDGAKPILMVTDPPYGVEYDPSWREGCDLGFGKRSKGKVLNDDRYDWSDAYSLFTGDVAYIWHPSKYTHKFAENIENSGFDLINLILWVRNRIVFGRGDYHYQHDPLWYAVKKGKQHNWQGKRDQSTVWEIASNNPFGNSNKEETFGHGTQKPIECMLRPILNNSAQGESVYDPFGGSGTTLIACERSKRNCYMMELSPAYVDVIIKRWEKETGQKAILEANE
jgi:site-specific DNA-methyltransferase (adenine-specific)